MSAEVFQFRFEAVPATSGAAPGEGGAFVVCWIRRAQLDEARVIAERIIEDAGWKVLRLEGSWIVRREDHESGSTGLEYFEQCLSDGEVAVFHSYPLDDAQ